MGHSNGACENPVWYILFFAFLVLPFICSPKAGQTRKSGSLLVDCNLWLDYLKDRFIYCLKTGKISCNFRNKILYCCKRKLTGVSLIELAVWAMWKGGLFSLSITSFIVQLVYSHSNFSHKILLCKSVGVSTPWIALIHALTFNPRVSMEEAESEH